MNKISAAVLSFGAFCLLSCSGTVEPQQLHGRWKYVKVDNRNPEDQLPPGELEMQQPAIIFSKDDSLVIEWGGERLSKGKFRMDGKMIRYKEDLDGGRQREFPFLIKSITEQELVFSTMEQNTTTVTAVKD